jgi:hypothetical protein
MQPKPRYLFRLHYYNIEFMVGQVFLSVRYQTDKNSVLE